MKILIVKTSALGDVIQAFPVLQYLKNCYPEAEIDWVVENELLSLVEAHPCLNEAIAINSKKWRKHLWKRSTRKEVAAFLRQLRSKRYDLLFDLQSNVKSGLVNAWARAHKKVGFGKATAHEWPNILFTNRRYNPPKGLNIREDYLFLAQQTVGNANSEINGVKLLISDEEAEKIHSILQHPQFVENQPRIMVCTGSNWPNKQLNKESLTVFLKSISEKMGGQFLFAWGMEEERRLAEELKAKLPRSIVIDKLKLPTLQNLMAELDLVMAMDSLPLHLAATTPTPTYSVFGASSAQKYKPFGKNHAAFQGECPFGKTFEKRCPILRTCPTGRCVKDIQGETLFAHFSAWWNQTLIK